MIANLRQLLRYVVLLCGLSCLVSCKPQPPTDLPQTKSNLSEEELQKLRDAPLKLLYVGSPDAAEELQVQFQGRGETKLQVDVISIEQWNQLTIEALNAYDVLVAPGDRIAQLAATGTILKMPMAELNRWNHSAWLGPERRRGRFDQEMYGISLGTPIWSVVYNPTAINSAALESDNEAATVPRTWAEWQQRISVEDQSSESPQWIESFADFGATQSFLLRAASMAKDASQADVVLSRIDGQPRIHTAPFVRALDELKATYGPQVQQLKGISVQDALHRVQSGQAKAALIPLPRLDDVNAGQSNLRIAPPLGSDRYYSFFDRTWSVRERLMVVQVVTQEGLSVCVLRKTRKSEAAYRLIELLSSPPTDLAIAKYHSLMTPFRREHQTDLPNWAGRQYSLDAIQSISAVLSLAQDDVQGGTVILPPLPGNHERIIALDRAVWQVLNGEQESAAALLECRDKWLEIASQYGEPLNMEILQKGR